MQGNVVSGKASYILAAVPALVAAICAAAAPRDGARVPDSNGVCCVEPFPYSIAVTVGKLAPVIVAFSFAAIVIIWRRHRRSQRRT